MNLNSRKLQLMALMTAMATATTTAATVSFDTKAPVRGPDDVSNLTGANTESGNVNEGDNDATYIADDRPTQGQTFTTGTNAAAYLLRSVTLREVSFETYALIPDLTYTVRITQPVDGKIRVVASETAKVNVEVPGNLSTIGGGADLGTGSGKFITFVFEKAVKLNANTLYGFDVSGGTERHYWQWDGTENNPYGGGSAYSVSRKGQMTERKGDHEFIVAMSPLTSTEAGKIPARAAEPAQAAQLAKPGASAGPK
jgi:hypothetical protein